MGSANIMRTLTGGGGAQTEKVRKIYNGMINYSHFSLTFFFKFDQLEAIWKKLISLVTGSWI